MNQMKKRIKKPLYTATVLIVTCILLLLFAGFALFEFYRSKKDLVSMLEDEGFILLDALIASGERSILAYEELEQLMQSRLLNCAYLIEETDHHMGLTEEFLDRIALKMDLYRVHILDRSGKRVMSNRVTNIDSGTTEGVIRDPGVLEFLFNTESDSLVIGLRAGQNLKEVRYAVVVRRRNGGGIIVAADAKMLASFRKELGPGRLIQEIGDRSGIVYVVLQDMVGILLASKDVDEMSRVSTDLFLDDIFQRKSRGSRFSSYQDREIFEITGSFLLEGDHLGIFRIGLETEHYRNILRNARYRLFLTALIFIVVGIVGLSFMVSSQNVKLLSESYQRVKTHTGEILQNMEDAVVVIDSKGRITLFNDAAMKLFSIPNGKVAGRSIQSLEIPSLLILQESLDRCQPVDRPHREVIIQNKKRILSMRTTILKRDDGEIDTVILVATDFTVQSHLEEQVHQQEKFTAMGKLASGVAHEIRNPINAIGMIAQRFLKEFTPRKDEKEYRDLTRMIVKETRRSNEIVQRFLRFAKPPPVNLSPVPVEELLNEVGGLLRTVAEARGVDLRVQVDESAILQLDRDKMKQALLNLIQNGLDATSSGGHIRITGEVMDASYVISVSDTGSGISMEERHKIFDLYYTTRKEGTGMGLAIVYQIVQSHGGEVDVESQVGKGTTFQIRLPMEEQI